MNRISVLDCTLRDGGYVNNFLFGNGAIKDIIRGLSKAAVDIIECGFLKSGEENPDVSLFGSIRQLQNVIGKKNKNLMYVAMVQCGAISCDEIDIYNGKSIDGIRLTFHEHEIEEAFAFGRQLMDKGYKVFMQPVGTTTYEDQTLINLIKRVNNLMPFAFYMVDTLGMMYKNDLIRLFYIIDHNLDKRIALGFHSHNNLQMSFANAQELAQLNSPRNIIIDASVLGMGRGAGNLNTELLIQYLNVNFGTRYDNLELMDILDKYIRPLGAIYKWGYDAAYYIAAVAGCHPNYASFLLNRQTLHMHDINTILNGLDEEKRTLYDEKYMETEYLKYMDHYVDDEDARRVIREAIGEKKVLIIAPGKSVRGNKNDIKKMAADGTCFVISINFLPSGIPVDMVYISNLKRFKNVEELKQYTGIRIVVTSNIKLKDENNFLVVNYSSYLNEDNCIMDNAGLMCINLLSKLNVKNYILAGFDGFSGNIKENYYEQSLYLDVEEERLADMNRATARRFEQLSKQIDISFLTESTYEMNI